jgi:hypothetical protein
VTNGIPRLDVGPVAGGTTAALDVAQAATGTTAIPAVS